MSMTAATTVIYKAYNDVIMMGRRKYIKIVETTRTTWKVLREGGTDAACHSNNTSSKSSCCCCSNNNKKKKQ